MTKENSGFLSEKIIHKHGFVRLIEVMGSDKAIEDAARMSYGGGTRKVSDTRNLIRYLLRNKHTSPFEMGVVRFHIRLPIFVMRQHIRHRTASVNEYSMRYSEAPDFYYEPEDVYLAPQSTSNKQGRQGAYTSDECSAIREVINSVCENAYSAYRKLRDEFNLSRELARLTIPVAGYTECVWQINLHNLFHYLKLRADKHAQQEIQDLANAMIDLVRPHFPISFEAWDDYIFHAKTLSRMEQDLLYRLVIGGIIPEWGNIDRDAVYKRESGTMSRREWDEFCAWIDKTFVNKQIALQEES